MSARAIAAPLSVDDYLAGELVSAMKQDAPHVWANRRQSDGTCATEIHSGLDTVIPLPEIETDLPLADLYDRITFED